MPPPPPPDNGPSQDDRLGKLHPPSPLRANDLVLLRFDGREAVNELFRFSVEAMTAKPSIAFEPLLGKHFTVEITTIYGKPRYFDGILTASRALGLLEGGTGYELTLEPMISVLDKRHNQRIFNDRTAQDIITKVLGDYGFQADFDVSGLSPVEYVVQYGESDLAFIRRIMERFGFNFYFTHDLGAHRLKINDGTFSAKIPGDKRAVAAVTGQHVATEEHFDSWIYDRLVTSGKVRVTDYDFKNPKANLEATQTGNATHQHGQVETFLFPGGYTQKDDSKGIAAKRLKQLRGADNRHRATGDVLSLQPGQLVTASGAKDAEVGGREFVALACQHSFTSEAYSTGHGGGAAGEDSYRGSYEFSPSSQPVLPPMVTPRAVIKGPQVGIVTDGQDGTLDEYGRIVVQFPWDANAQSVRCRVLQPWAGNGMGHVFIPRVGMEVLVEFLNGDPDQPVVVGCLYNGQNKPPYDLPGQKNISGIKSASIGGGTYNEFIFDDTGGSELVRTHAGYDMETTVENDQRLTVKQNQTTQVSQVYDITADQKLQITVGACKLVMDGTKIELTIGPSKVTMNAQGVQIEGMEVKASGKMNLETSGGLTAKHTAGAQMTVQAAIVMIN